MPARRQPLLVFVAAAALLFPACISIQADPTPITPPEDTKAKGVELARKTEFAVLPSRPGVVVHPNAGSKDTTAQKPPQPDPEVKVAAEPPHTFPPLQPAPLAESPLSAGV